METRAKARKASEDRRYELEERRLKIEEATARAINNLAQALAGQTPNGSQ